MPFLRRQRSIATYKPRDRQWELQIRSKCTINGTRSPHLSVLFPQRASRPGRRRVSIDDRASTVTVEAVDARGGSRPARQET